jgi:hypothetical protein
MGNENKPSYIKELESTKEHLSEADKESIRKWIDCLKKINLSELIVNIVSLEKQKTTIQPKITLATKIPITRLDGILARQNVEWDKFKYEAPTQLTTGAQQALERLSKNKISLIVINDLLNPNHLRQKYLQNPGELLGNIKSAISELRILSN